MSVDQLLLKAQQRKKKARFEAGYSIIIGLALFVFFALGCARIPELAPRLGFGVISLWSLYFAYKSYARIWRGRPAPDATLYTTIRSYRAELEKQSGFGRSVWLLLVPPFLGMALIVVPALIRSLHDPRILPNLVPFFALLAIWIVMLITMRRRRQRKLEQEIEQLDAFVGSQQK